jgi:hypothetical protein
MDSTPPAAWKRRLQQTLRQARQPTWPDGSDAEPQNRLRPHADDWDRLRTQLVVTVDDLDMATRFNLLVRILRAETPDDLWALRVPVFDALAHRLGEAVAQGRLKQFDALWSGDTTASPARAR